jgi:hypothetical protein
MVQKTLGFVRSNLYTLGGVVSVGTAVSVGGRPTEAIIGYVAGICLVALAFKTTGR